MSADNVNANAADVDDPLASAILKAEKDVAKILAALEKQTGSIVNAIGVNDIEITTLSDVRPQWLRRVEIEMKRLPGTNWGQ